MRDMEVINCGVNGMTVPREYSRYVGLIRANEPDLVTVMLGTNDLCRGISAEQTADRMERFLDSIAGPGRPILLISPPLLQAGLLLVDPEMLPVDNPP